MLPLRASVESGLACGVVANSIMSKAILRALFGVDFPSRRRLQRFKFLDPLSGIDTYPSGALKRAGASSGRAIAVAVRDVPTRPPRRNLRRTATFRSGAVPLMADDSRAGVLAKNMIGAL